MRGAENSSRQRRRRSGYAVALVKLGRELEALRLPVVCAEIKDALPIRGRQGVERLCSSKDRAQATQA